MANVAVFGKTDEARAELATPLLGIHEVHICRDLSDFAKASVAILPAEIQIVVADCEASIALLRENIKVRHIIVVPPAVCLPTLVRLRLRSH